VAAKSAAGSSDGFDLYPDIGEVVAAEPVVELEHLSDKSVSLDDGPMRVGRFGLVEDGSDGLH